MVGVGLGEVGSIVLLSVRGVDWSGVGVGGIVVGVGWGAWGYTTGVGEIPWFFGRGMMVARRIADSKAPGTTKKTCRTSVGVR